MRAKSVLIVGAGTAGLTAGYFLRKHGYKVLLLEARDRIGGRIVAVDNLDMGGQWIHGTEGNPLTTLVHEHSIPLIFVGGDSTYLGGWDDLQMRYGGGKVMSPEQKAECISVWDSISHRIEILQKKKLESSQTDCSFADLLAEVLSSYSNLTLIQKRYIAWHVNALVRDDCAAELNRLSCLHWDEGYQVYGYGDSLIPKGYNNIINLLAKKLDIKLNTVVTKIDYKEKVKVYTDKEVFSADAVVVTLPLGVLKAGTVNFDPPLDEQKQKAIKRLEMGDLTKVIVFFKKPFWPKEQYIFGYFPKNIAYKPTQVINCYRLYHVPALSFIIGGKEGKKIETFDQQQLFDWSMEILRDMFGENIPLPTRLLKSEWSHDPYSRGAYCYVALGSTPEDIKSLSKSIRNKVFFAGEATNTKYWGCVHSAYMSGIRAAARILQDNSIFPLYQFTENRRWRNTMIRVNRFFAMKKRAVNPLDLQEIIATLKISRVFKVIPLNELKLLALMFEKRFVAKGKKLCKKGDIATEAYVIHSGDITVKANSNLEEMIQKRGNVIGVYGLFTHKKRTATLIAKTDVVVLALEYETFRHFLIAFPESMFRLFGKTVSELVRV